MRKTLLVIMILVMATSVFAQTRKPSQPKGVGAVLETVPAPLLVTPFSHDTDVTGKDALEFKWSPYKGISALRAYYDFRLYKGYGAVETAAIYKQEVPPDMYQVNIPSDKFENEGVYTWGVSQVYSDGRKSSFSYYTFSVIKK